MSAYIDSALLVKAYCLETTSSQAIALIRQAARPLLVTPLHLLEIPNALRLKRHRQELSETELADALSDLQADLEHGLLVQPHLELSSVFQKAGALSSTHTVSSGARSLDILHVAAALILGTKEFFSFDIKQRKLAERAGLSVRPAKIPAPLS